MLIHDMEEIWRCQFPRWSQQCFDIMTKRNDNLMVRDIGTLLDQYWWKRLHMKELETLMMDIGYAWFMMAVQRNGSNIAKIKMGIMLFPSYSGTLWWYSNKSRIDENTHLFHTIGKSTYITEEVQWVFQSILVSGIILGGKEEDKARKQSFWHHWIFLERTRKRRSLISITQFLKKLHMKLVGNATKMLCTRYDWKKRRIKDCNSGKRNHLQSWPTSQYQETALTVWLLKTEIEYFSKGLRHQGPHPRSRWSGIGKASSSSKSSSRSSPFHTQTYLVSGNRERPGKARQKCKTTRNTSQKRTKYRETGSNSLLTWMWILISVTKKSAQMHSWRTKLWKKNSQIRIQRPLKESKLVQIKFVFAKIWRRRRWCLAKNPAKLFSRWVMWSSLSWRHPWFNAIMPTLRF